MRFGSVCSGVEAASVAWHPLGWRAAWLAEIEPFPAAVLRYHYPEVPNLGDMTALPNRIRSGEVEAPDLFCGGTPCQAFSVAGLRRSLDDARGNLSLTFCEIADAIDSVRLAASKPASIVFWENVPGVLSTADNAFGCFLAGLAGESEPLVPPGRKWEDAGCVLGPARAIAWRTVDAQYFGLAQRRRRVFVVASARDDFDPAAVLLEWEGLRRDTPPSREAGEGASRGASAGAGSGIDFQNAALSGDMAGTLDAEGQRRGNRGHGILAFGGGQNCAQTDVSTALSAHPRGSRLDFQTETFVAVAFADTAPTLSVGAHGAAGHPHRQHGNETAIIGMQPWKCPDCGNGMAFNHRGCRLFLAHAFDARQSGVLQYGNMTGPLDTDGHSVGGCVGADCFNGTLTGQVAATLGANSGQSANHAGPAVLQPVAVTSESGDIASTLRTGGNDHADVYNSVAAAMQVRRLTPVECERLQGFPDGYTAIPWRGKTASECPDGPRCKALGNSWAVPVVRWIGRRINERIGNA